jgi:hypothetical protein
LFNKISSKLRKFESGLYDARATVELASLGIGFKPWPASAIAPSALKMVINDIIINQRSTVIEFGAGLSTVYLAKVLKDTGGRLISIESDCQWAQLVQGWLAAEGLSEAVNMVIAPMAPCSIGIGGLEWYDTDIVKNAIRDDMIDCVLVDGPIAYKAGMGLARYPAIPTIKHRLADRFSIFLDDTNRPGERQITESWGRELGTTFSNFEGRGAISRAVVGHAFDSQI